MWNHDEMPLLPATGQATSYRTGDDGYFKAGRPGGNRFGDVGNGTIHDRATGLLWVKQPERIIPGATGVHAANQAQAARGNWANATAYAKADLAKDTAGSTYWVCVAAHTSASASTTFAQDRAANPTYWRQSVWAASAANLTTPATMGWDAAVDACLGLSYAGQDDWRLPNVSEQMSLFGWDRTAAPMIVDPVMFPNTPTTSWYFTSTTDRFAPTQAIVVCNVYPTWPCLSDAKTTPRYVRPVRGGRINV
jgi:hypothetical protein